MLESRTFGHMSSIFQGHSETTRLLFTTCLPRLPSQPGGTPYRGAGGFVQNFPGRARTLTPTAEVIADIEDM